MLVDPIKPPKPQRKKKRKSEFLRRKAFRILLSILPGIFVAAFVFSANVYYDLDQGAGTVVIQNDASLSNTTASHLVVSDLTASRLIASNANKALVSTDLSSWISGTTNQITVTDNGDGTVTLSTPQDIGISSSPTFSGLTLSSLTQGSVLFVGSSGVISQDNSNLYWDDTNNRLGIGTASPGARLHVSGGDILLDNTYALRIKDSAGTAQTIVRLDSSDVAYFRNPVANSSFRILSGGALQFFESGSEIMRIVSGNVGIGTTSPGARLEIADGSTGSNYDLEALRFSASFDPTDFTRIMSRHVEGQGQALDFETNFYNGASREIRQAVTILPNGNVGIGTTDPGAKLHVAGNILIDNQKGFYAKDSGGTTRGIITTDTNNDITFLGTAWNDLFIQNAGVGTFTILNGGNVGIGTTSPGAKLEVNASTGDLLVLDTTVDMNNVMRFKRQGTEYGALYNLASNPDFYIRASNANGKLFLSGGGGSAQVAIDTNGNVGIGTTDPGTFLHIKGDVSHGPFITLDRTQAAANDDVAIIGVSNNGAASNDFLWFGESTADKDMVLMLDSGNVGIGTTNPKLKLVVGDDIGSRTGNNALAVGDADGDPYLFLGNDSANWGAVYFENSSRRLGFSTRNADTTYADTLVLKDGNVGIGTASPGAKLEVADGGLAVRDSSYTNNDTRPAFTATSTVADYEIRGYGASLTSDDGFLRLRAGGGTSANTGSYIDLSGYSQQADMNNNIVFGTAAEERMRIDSSGNVGISTTSPQQKLTLGPSSNLAIELSSPSGLSATTSASGTLNGTYYYKVSASDGVGWTTLSSEEVSATVDGGTTAGTITVSWSAVTGATKYRVWRGTSSGNQTEYYETTSTSIDDDGSLTYTSATPPSSTTAYIAKVTSSGNSWFLGGNVGIGTTDPEGYKLNIQGDVFIPAANEIVLGNVDRVIKAPHTAELGSMVFTGHTSAYKPLWSFRDQNNNAIMVIGAGSGASNVGIGTTSPGAKLDVAGDILLSGSTLRSIKMSAGSDTEHNLLIDFPDVSTAAASLRLFRNTNTSGTRSFNIYRGNGLNEIQTLLNAYGDSYINALTGNVGIGTTSPSYKLHVNGGEANLIAQFVSTDPEAMISFKDDTSTSNYTGIGATGDKLSLYTTSAKRLTIDSSGNVGIGTTSPSEKLEVVGDIAGTRLKILGTDGNYIKLFSGAGTAPNQHVHFMADYVKQTDATEVPVYFGYNGEISSYQWHSKWSGTDELLMIINATNGNVGIGTASPSEKLEVNGDILLSGGARYLRFTGGAARIKSETSVLYINPDTNTDTSIGDGSTGNLFYNGSGNVGIGTTSPGSKLTVDGGDISILNGNRLLVYNSDSSKETRILNDASGYESNLKFYTASAASPGGVPEFRMIIDTNGNVGIGTTDPTVELDVAGDVRINGSDGWSNDGDLAPLYFGSVGAFGIAAEHGEGLIFGVYKFENAGTLGEHSLDAMFIEQTTGNVGIGTTGPGAALHVLKTTEQLRLGYDASNYASFTVGSGGALTIASTNNANITLNAGTGTVIIGDGTGKLDAGTVDPKYNINGITYATYLPSMSGGVKEEVTGTIKLEPTSEQNLFTYIIDFGNLEGGSDLWLFSKIIDWGEDMKNLTVLLSSESGAKVSYKKDPQNNRLIIFGNAPVEVSYRLTAPRFDYENWSNIAKNQNGGFDIPETEPNINSNASTNEPNYEELYSLLNDDVTSLTVQEDPITQQIVLIDSNQLKRKLADIGLVINENGTLSVNKVQTNELEVGSQSKPSGITLYDDETGQPYCLKIKNGEIVKETGKCDVKTQNSNLKTQNHNEKVKDGEPNNNQTQEQQAPETQLISHPEKETISTNAIFEFSSNIENTTYQCQINNQGWQPCESPKEYVNLLPGEYVFEVYAVSQNGEYDETPEVYEWKIVETQNSEVLPDRQADKSQPPNPEVKTEELNENQDLDSSSNASENSNPEDTTDTIDTTEESCIPNWQCSDWQPLPDTVCLGETFIQTRECVDLNECGVETEKPEEEREMTGEKDCSETAPTTTSEEETTTSTTSPATSATTTPVSTTPATTSENL